MIKNFLLSQNYPNPFNPTTSIDYTLPKSSPVTLKIFNLLGQEIRTLVNEHQSAGTRTVVWDGQDHSGRQVSSGIYVYQLQAGNVVRSRKMLLVR
jgi:flagellar hook assembly protein FlgD